MMMRNSSLQLKLTVSLNKLLWKLLPSLGWYIDQLTPGPQNTNNFDFDQLETQRIFTWIKSGSLYWLPFAFFDLKYFKGNIPKEGIEKITQLEKEHQTSLERFKIMAPSVLFRLKKQMTHYFLSLAMTTSTSFTNGVKIYLFSKSLGMAL